ncbi:acyltransferase [Kineosporia sp. NBRC 101677]|uniref:acyltransferase family protein n=1 Tax=Kineosporia sp. NBRC 101677 TaxID=3032197 RepID=UPI0024A5CBB1|nr:acyltransferase family protein [Kineosporia sp. NBRC 101677]GLY15907.1 acyltransferase [Kineosporia sp. NBRC 101677]
MKRAPRDEPLETPQSPDQTVRAGTFRGDIQGLRAVAVLVVLLYHTGLGPSGGFIGVDVFFVLSGFLITGLLVREHEKTGRISLPQFWARRARRLLPASALVLLVTCVGARWYLPASQWQSIGQDAMAAAAYVVNWRLAAESVDYLAEGSLASPLQHYWSLAIEEQFYVVWPLLLSVLLLARRRAVATAVIGLVVVVSLTLALTTYSAQTYFTTHTRVWELAAGALCAVAFARRPLPQGRSLVAALLSWAGLAMILVALFVVKPETMWPGPLTVLVVAGTMLLLRYGPSAGGARLVLALPPMRWLGDISYSLYLWHWPLVVFAQVDGELTRTEGLSIVGIGVVLATLTYYLVEGPARKARFWAPSALGIAGGLTLTLVAVGSGTALAHSRSVEVPVQPLGAAAAYPAQDSASALAPPPERAKDDNGEIYERGCASNYASSDPRPCVFDHSKGPNAPVVYVVGDSKAGQWAPALLVLAQQHGWKLVSMTKAGCPFSDIHRLLTPDEGYTTCEPWNQAVLEEIRAHPPTLLVTTQLQFYRSVKDGRPLPGEANRQELIRGMAVRLQQMHDLDVPVLAMAETPRMGEDVAACVSLHLDDLDACAKPRDSVLKGLVVGKAAEETDTPVADLTDRVCAAYLCPPVIGDVLVYRDDHHLTATFSRTLAPFLDEEMARVLDPWLVERLMPDGSPVQRPAVPKSVS